MNWYDYLILVILGVLFILALAYTIKNKGCTSSKCKNCMKECSKRIK